jgi:hypothetical protein
MRPRGAQKAGKAKSVAAMRSDCMRGVSTAPLIPNPIRPPSDLLSSKKMRRGIHISVALLAVLVLIRPFDCFGGGFTRKAAACCAAGKCVPSSNADDCCKNTIPGSNQLTAPKAPSQPAPVHAVIVADVRDPLAPSFVAFCFDEAHAPPGSPPSSRLNLPLLI